MEATERLQWTGSETYQMDEDGGTRIRLQISDVSQSPPEEPGCTQNCFLMIFFYYFLSLEGGTLGSLY